jgi:hypothetical protein
LDSAAATTFTVNNDTQITATTPTHAAGAVNVVVTTPGGTATGTGVFTYVAPLTFTSITPTSGPTTGGTAVTIVGTNFVSGSSLAVTIGGTAATGVSVTDATHIAATTPAGTYGAKDVVVTNGDGASTATGTGAFTYVTSPTISSITPASPTNSGSQTIVIVGTGFNGSTVTLTQAGQSTITGVVTGTDTTTTISRNFNLNGIASGTWNVVILNVDGGTVTGTLTVNSATTATITSISPTNDNIRNRFCCKFSNNPLVP